MTATRQSAAPTGRKQIAQSKEPGGRVQTPAVDHASQSTSSPEGAKEGDALPKGWRWITLGDVAQAMKNGLYKPVSSYAADGLACLRMDNIGDGKIVWRDIKRMRLSEAEIREYELLPGGLHVNRVNSRELVGKSVAIPTGLERCVFESKNIRVRIRRDLASPEFVSYRLLSAGSRYFTQNAQQVVGMASIRQPQVARFPLPLPPLPEPRRIVAEIEKTFTRLEAGVAAVRRVQANLKRYRAAVLKAACEGKLVPTEAELTAKNAKSAKTKPDSLSASSAFSAVKNPSCETGAALLARSLTERRQNWQGRGKYKEPAAADTANLPAIPDGWTWATVEQLAAPELNSITDGPFGSNLKTGHYRDSGPRVIRLQNIGDGVYGDEEAHISPAHFERLQKHRIFANAVVIAGFGENPPRSGIIADALGPAIVKADGIRCKPHSSVMPKYMNAALNSDPLRKRTKGMVHGVGRPRLNLGEIKSIVLPLPPLAEQTRIVAAVERRLSVAEELAAVVSANLQRATRLRQSILPQAFTGKLLTTDNADNTDKE